MQATAPPDTDGAARWRGKTVLVTGASGFLGGHLTERLRAGGAAVAGVSRTQRSDEKAGLTWHQCDLEDAERVADLLARVRPDAIFHLNSLADGKRDLDLVLPTFRADVVSSLNLLLAAARHPVERVLLSGSLEEADTGKPPSSPYGAAKACTTLYGELFRALYDVPVVSARIFMCYGPGQPDWKVIPTVARALMRGQVPAIASPERAADWIYVNDAVGGLLAAVAAPAASAARVDIGTGKLTTIREIVTELRDLVQPGLTLDFSQAQPRANEEVKCADASATQAAIGWRARVGLNEGLRATIQALRADLDSRVEDMTGADVRK